MPEEPVSGPVEPAHVDALVASKLKLGRVVGNENGLAPLEAPARPFDVRPNDLFGRDLLVSQESVGRLERRPVSHCRGERRVRVIGHLLDDDFESS